MLRSGHCSACSFKGYFPANYYYSTSRQVVKSKHTSTAPNVVLIWSSTFSFMLEGSRAFLWAFSGLCLLKAEMLWWFLLMFLLLLFVFFNWNYFMISRN